MAGHFKKRRKAGPSKNEEKVRRGMEAERHARGLLPLKERFPGVASLKVRLEFLTPQGQVFETRDLRLGPADPCDFGAPCPGRCMVGRFDLAAGIEGALERRETAVEINGTCPVPLFAGSPDVCGLELRCRIEASYLPA